MESLCKEEIGEILKNLRRNAGMTQAGVATLLNRSQQAIAHWESGYSQPDVDTLFKLAELYNADLSEAFGFKDSLQPTKEEYILIRQFRNAHDSDKKAVACILSKYPKTI